ncbi:hypothetical protein ACHWQZ_G008674 [Mnemiopsis leidyi]
MSFGSISYSDEEFNEIQGALRKRLGADFVATRPGPGGQKLHYVEGWRVVQLANETFGFDGWGYSVTNMTVDFVDHLAGKFNVGVSATVKVTLKNGSFREDVGYGCVDGMRSKSQAVEKARKESITDGLKRAMKSFGNLLGNCLSDKEYVRHISKKASKQPEHYPTESIAEPEMTNLPNSRRSFSTSAEKFGKPRKRSPISKGANACEKKVFINNTSTPVRVDSKYKNVTDENVVLKKNSTSIVQFDREELTNILSQDSFADFSQLEDSALWEDVLSNINESAIRKSTSSGSSSTSSRTTSTKESSEALYSDTESREAIKDALSGSQETMFDKIKVPELPRIRKEVERVRRTVKRVHTFTSTKELRDRFDLKDIKLPSLS